MKRWTITFYALLIIAIKGSMGQIGPGPGGGTNCAPGHRVIIEIDISGCPQDVSNASYDVTFDGQTFFFTGGGGVLYDNSSYGSNPGSGFFSVIVENTFCLSGASMTYNFTGANCKTESFSRNIGSGATLFGSVTYMAPPFKNLSVAGSQSIYCGNTSISVCGSASEYIWQVSENGVNGWREFERTTSNSTLMGADILQDASFSSSKYGSPRYVRVRPSGSCGNYRMSDPSESITFYRPIPTGFDVLGLEPEFNCDSQGGVTISNLRYSDLRTYSGEAIIISILNSGGTRGYSQEHSDSLSYTIRDDFLIAGTGYRLKIENAVEVGENTCASNGKLFDIDPAPTFTVNTPTLNREISCNSSSTVGSNSDGRISVSVSNGKPPFDYYLSKNGGAYGSAVVSNRTSRSYTYTNLSEGNYKVRVIDDCNDIKVNTTTITLSEPAALSISSNITSDYNGSDLSCANSTDGEISITGSGGTGSKTYSINGGTSFSSNNVFNGLGEGTYNIRLKDSIGCEQAGPAIRLNAPTAVAINSVDLVEYDGYNVSCSGVSDGQVVLVNETGGTGTKEYSIDGGDYVSSSNFTGLSAGAHIVRVKDANNCIEQTTITLTAPPVLSISGSVTSDYGSGRQLSCSGASDGEVTLNASGGRGTYEYTIDNGVNWQDGSVFNNLSSGTYIVKVRDKLVPTCIQAAASNIVISDPPSIDLSENISSYNGNEVSCNGATDGSITLSVSGGSGSFTYSWSNGLTTKDLTGIEAGTYTVIITDANGCSINESYTLSEPATLLGSAIASNFNGFEISCNGATDGAVDLDVSGGTMPYSYNWSNGATTQDLTNLNPGTYSVVITDANGCTSSIDNINITQPDELNIQVINITDVDCNGLSTGAVELSSIGGTSTKEYSIDATNYQTDDTFINLSQGSYTLYVRDANGCTDQTDITITEPPILTGSVTRETDATCGELNGEAEVNVTGGTTPYNYIWTNTTGDVVGTNAILTGVGGGVYTATITDDNGCEITRTANVSSEDGAIVSTSSTTATSCFDSADGQATITISGASPFDIVWSSGETGETANQLTSGDNVVTVTDSNGCVVVEVITIDSPEAISYTITNSQQPTCHDSNDGSLAIQALGGTGSYTYAWNTGTIDPSLTDITQGTYQVTITDANGCSFTDAITLEGVDPISITITETTEPTCVGDADGSVTVDAAGGNGNYTYQWDNGTTGAQITDVPAGEYRLTVTDEKGCATSETITLEEPEAFEIDLGGTVEICEGASYEIGHPLPNATYIWASDNGFSSTDGTVIVNEPGIYTLEVINEDGCVATDSFELIVSSDLLNADFLMVNEAYVGDTVIVIDISWPIPDDVAWAFDEGITVIEQNKDLAVLTFTEPGRYEVFMDVSLADCQDFYSQSINVLPASERPNNTGRTSSKEKLITSFRVYPNPSDGYFDIEADLSQNADVNIKMIDLTGNTIVIDKTISDTNELRMPFNQSLKKGLYLVMIKAEGESKTKRLMVK